MNLYFIVEGRRTEKKVYPSWLKLLLPELRKVKIASEATFNNYYLFNGNGFPALLHNHLKNSIDEVNELKIFNYLVIALDVDDSTIDNRVNEVNNFVISNNLELNNTELIIIPQNKCIESWFLGNHKIFKKNPQNRNLLKYIEFYNVKTNDPEAMGLCCGFNSYAQFHADYCSKYLNERNIKYTKNNPRGVTEKDYLNNLIARINKTNHLKSFGLFIDFINKVKKDI